MPLLKLQRKKKKNQNYIKHPQESVDFFFFTSVFFFTCILSLFFQLLFKPEKFPNKHFAYYTKKKIKKIKTEILKICLLILVPFYCVMFSQLGEWIVSSDSILDVYSIFLVLFCNYHNYLCIGHINF